MAARKYNQGEKITSLGELMKQDFVYFNHKIVNYGWFQNWQIGWTKRVISLGFVHKAIKITKEEN